MLIFELCQDRICKFAQVGNVTHVKDRKHMQLTNNSLTFMKTFLVYEPLKLPTMERSHDAIEEWDEMFLLVNLVQLTKAKCGRSHLTIFQSKIPKEKCH